MRYFSPSEYMVLMFVFDRTVGWGKLVERVKLRHFESGIEGVTCGTGMPSKTVRRALSALVEKQTLVRTRGRDGDTYGINFDWKPEEDVLKLPKKDRQTREGALAQPKNREQSGQIDHSDWSNRPPRVVNLTGHKNITPQEGNFEEPNRREATPSRSPSVLGDTIERAKARAAARASAKESKARGSARVADLRVFWEKAWRETYEGYPCPAWSPKARGQLATLVKGLDLGQGQTVTDFLDWVVRSWATVRATRLWWMQERPAPERPDVGFLVVFKDKFLDAWGDRTTLHQEMSLTREQRLTRRNMREGMSYEQAKEAAARDAERADQRDRLAEQKAEVGRSASALIRLRDELAAKERSLRIDQGIAARERGEAPVQRARAPRVTVEIDSDTEATIASLPQGGFEDGEG